MTATSYLDSERCRVSEKFSAARHFCRSCYEVTGMKVVATVEEARVISATAFSEFYQQAADIVFRYLARSVLGNRAVAEDLTQ